MSKKIFLLTTFAIILSLGIFFAFQSQAVPAPDATYCEEQGYTSEIRDSATYCIFPDGNECEGFAFLNGECGDDYKEDLTCKEAGEEIKTGECCEGLVSIKNDEPGSYNGCAGKVGSWAICSDCSNGVCESWENSCNCSEDCKESQTSCAEEGEQFSGVYAQYPDACCTGLTEWHSGMDSRTSIGTECYETGLLKGSPVGTCINYGDGICARSIGESNEAENICNSPADCVNGENSRFATVEEFCNSDFWLSTISPNCDNMDLPICSLCDSPEPPEEVICIPETTRCSGSNYETCNTYGIGWDLTDTCEANENCVVDQGCVPIEQPLECPAGFIISQDDRNQDYCQPRILDITWDADLSTVLADSIWVRAMENGEVKNFLNNQNFISDVQQAVGSETDQEEIARKIANWMRKLKPYAPACGDYDDPCYNHSPVNNVNTDLSDFDYIYNYPEGVCFDAAVLTVAALRVAGIPAMTHFVNTAHIDTIAYINNEWMNIDTTFCSQEEIDSNNCQDISWRKRLSFRVNEKWAPSGNEYCRRDGFCITAPGIPSSNEILISSAAIPSATIIYPRFKQILKNSKSFSCGGNGWNTQDEWEPLSDEDRESKRQLYLNNVLVGLLYIAEIDTVLFNDLPHIGYFKAEIPENLFFIYQCTLQNGDTVAYYDVVAKGGDTYIITADDLTKTDKISDEDFNWLKQKIKEHTEDLGILPTESPVGIFASSPGVPATDSTGAVTLEQITADAVTVVSGNVNQVIAKMGVTRDVAAEANYNETIVSKVIAGSAVTVEVSNTITNFVTYGTKATKVLGAGERGGVVNSFKAAFGKLPTTLSEWNDVVKIANGRWPSVTSETAENKATETFKKIYLRSPDMLKPHDNAAVTVMAYGLRSAQRNLDSERNGIKFFKAIFGYNPTSASNWDAVRAIAYSGATR